ncbi:MAG TPA: nuclear transport factor 2 family protein [Blastocatellia bacterium]
MSQENVAIIRGMYEAFARGDVAAVLSALSPKVEWHEADNFIYADGNPYIGPDAVLEGVFKRLAVEWEGFAVEPAGILDAGDTVVAYGYYTGRYRKTGEAVRAQFAHMFTLENGKLAKFQQYTDTAQFARAVGDSQTKAAG